MIGVNKCKEIVVLERKSMDGEEYSKQFWKMFTVFLFGMDQNSPNLMHESARVSFSNIISQQQVSSAPFGAESLNCR